MHMRTIEFVCLAGIMLVLFWWATDNSEAKRICQMNYSADICEQAMR